MMQPVGSREKVNENNFVDDYDTKRGELPSLHAEETEVDH
jgi:hypothetical protein